MSGWPSTRRRSRSPSCRPTSPDLNPDEGLNADLKQHITRKAPMRRKQALKHAAISHMRRLAKSPARVRRYFRQKPVRYAA